MPLLLLPDASTASVVEGGSPKRQQPTIMSDVSQDDTVAGPGVTSNGGTVASASSREKYACPPGGIAGVNVTMPL